ncbi:MAG: Flp pilus assembly complex ATPase component TadA [Deltaproteobacteria bacterium]|nr:Flp pilus assembly complex ATPase component TadA [Deltaproteobacteria bacterium]MBZ0219441.1 GspE/PulE family protein [Deltaproteobacteria bacterium]
MAVKKIGEILVESGLLSRDQVEEALKESKRKGKRLGSILVSKGYATEMDIAQTLSFQLNLPFIEIDSAIDPDALKLVPESISKKYLLIPLSREGKVLNVAMSDPLNLNAIDDLRFSTSLEVKPYVATIADVTTAINRYYRLNEPIENLVQDLRKDQYVEVVHEPEFDDLSNFIQKSTTPPIIKMVDSIIIQAIDLRASDIHIEPQENFVKLRFRIDGIMREVMQLPKWVNGPAVSRIKVMAKMDIAERRTSQDGRIKVRLGKKSLDLRVSTLPTQYGETVVMRVLDPKAAALGLDRLGFSNVDSKRLLGIIKRPQGVVIVTGPTGSGKTSSLYAMVSHIKNDKINIITIEDPLEYELRDVSQVAVNEKAGLTFAHTLRSVLRQDPDVILVGEMRDAETALIAHQASMTGHLVFSTLHTNDAVSSVTRLKNMGIPGYMVASALNGIVAQRLVRRICDHCKAPYAPGPDEAGYFPPKTKLYRGKGCGKCGGSGFYGRVGVFEILVVDRNIRKLISTDAPEEEIYAAALEEGMVTLQKDGLRKVLEGVTTLDELGRVVYLNEDRE